MLERTEELPNAIERCVLLSAGEPLPARWLHLELYPVPSTQATETAETSCL